jgi:TATA-box binding protein (TBP) (component of TFIID and TFIIIB)
MNEFENIKVSTNTFIIKTNINVNIKKLFETLPITEYIVVPKKRGRKPDGEMKTDPNKDITDGSIITLELCNDIRGVQLKKRKRREGSATDYFRNSITIIMVIDKKLINFKISRNGKFQMTGCKHEKHAEESVKYVWNYIRNNQDLYNFTNGDTIFRAIFVPAMRNIDFNLGFYIDREKLDDYFNSSTEYHSLLETSIGYTGVNIKIPVKKPISELKIKQLTNKKDTWLKPKFVPYQEYLDTLKPKDQQKKLTKDRFNTFLVFHSGKVIMSSMCEDFAREPYYDFLSIIGKNYEKFEEKLDLD